MRNYRNIATVLSLAAVGLGFAAIPARADANAPVCAFGYGKNDGLSCNFITYDQCRSAISGTSGTCIDNPYLRNALNRKGPGRR